MALGQVKTSRSVTFGDSAPKKCKVFVTVVGEAPQVEVSQDTPTPGSPYYLKIDSFVKVSGHCICEDECPEDTFKWEETNVRCKSVAGQGVYGSEWVWTGCVPAGGSCAAAEGCVGSFGPIYVLKSVKLGEARAGRRLDANTDPCDFGSGQIGKFLEENLSTQRDFLKTILPYGVELDCNQPTPID